MAVNPNETAYQQKPTAVNPNTQTYQQKPTATPAQQINSAMQKADQQMQAAQAALQQPAKSPALANPTGLGGPTAQKYQGMTTQQLVSDLQKKAEQMKAAQAAMQQPTPVSAQTQANAQTTQEATGNIYRVGDNGQAPKGLKVGDQVVTGGGTFTITGVNPDGTYTSKKTNPNQTTLNYTGTYATAPGTAPAQATQPKQPTYASAYDPNVNYDSEIAKAVAAGNLQAAAVLESLRNQKIDALGLANKYAKTNTYAQYLDGVDPSYAAQLRGGYVAQSITPPEFPMTRLTDYLDQQKAAEIAAAKNEIAYNVEKSTNELKRQEEDAQPKFQQRLNQNDIDAARAQSNSALYAEARGDRGGIGQSQYNEIAAAAMRNKQDINAERMKLSTDIARQIADLAAQGRFQERQQLLQISQNYLSQLFQLEKYNAEYGMSRAEFLQSAEQALRNYEIQRAQVTGEFEGQPTLAAQNAQKEWAAAAGELALKYGQMPTAEQLAAMGLTQEQAQGIIWQIQMESGFSGGGSSGGGGSSSRGSRSSGGGDGSGPEDANVSSGQYAAATGWSNAAGAPAASAGAGATGGLVVQGSGGSGSSGTGSSGNGGLSTDQIKAVQRALGVTADGIWGPQSQKAAGGLSAAAAYNKYVGSGSSRTVSHEDIDYKDASAVADAVRSAEAIRQMMLNGASKSAVSAKITELLKAGYISDDAARRLRAQNNQRP